MSFFIIYGFIVYRSAQVDFLDFFGGSSAANIASSNTFFKPFYKK
jgi:hypothetical protein